MNVIPNIMFAKRKEEAIDSTTRIFFLLEEHYNERDRKKNLAFLKKNYVFERGDIILIEDDEAKSLQELNLVQIEGLEKTLRVEGWDSHESFIKRKKISDTLLKIHRAIQNIESERGREEDVNFLFQTAKTIQLTCASIYNFNATEFLSDKFNDKRHLFLSSFKRYTQLARDRISYLHFSERQQSLINKIQEWYHRTSGKIFIMTGKNHLDIANTQINNSVISLFTALENKKYFILD